MEYNDYDLLLKHYAKGQAPKSVYFGDPNIYADGRILEIFPQGIDNVNMQLPLFVFATVVYLTYGEKILVLRPKKEDRVVETLTGLGGKVKAKIGAYDLTKEKTYLKEILLSYEAQTLGTSEEMKEAAAREVMEETSTYYTDEQGSYTYDITKRGLKIDPAGLNEIGTSRVRIINDDKTECWMIQNYTYPLSAEEYDFIVNEVSKSNREGELLWLSEGEILPNMSYADQLILLNKNANAVVTEIRDNVNRNNISRITVPIEKEHKYGTFIDGNLVFCSDYEYVNYMTVNKLPSSYKMS